MHNLRLRTIPGTQIASLYCSSQVEQDVARESQTIKNLLEDSGAADDLIPLPNVNGKILSKIIEFCKFHYEANKTGADGKKTKTEDEIKAGFGYGDRK